MLCPRKNRGRQTDSTGRKKKLSVFKFRLTQHWTPGLSFVCFIFALVTNMGEKLSCRFRYFITWGVSGLNFTWYYFQSIISCAVESTLGLHFWNRFWVDTSLFPLGIMLICSSRSNVFVGIVNRPVRSLAMCIFVSFLICCFIALSPLSSGEVELTVEEEVKSAFMHSCP